MLSLLDYCVYAYELCNGSIIAIDSFNEELLFKSPQYPQDYSITADGCSTTVVVSIGKIFVFNIKRKGVSLHHVKVQYTNGTALPYQYNVYKVEDGDVNFTHNVIVRTSTTEVLDIHLPAGEGEAFRFTVAGKQYLFKKHA